MAKLSGQSNIFANVEEREALEYELKDIHQSIVKLIYLTVSRPIEIITLKKEHIGANHITIQMSKTKSYKTLKITPNIRAVLDAIPGLKNNSSIYVFPSPSKKNGDKPLTYRPIALDIQRCSELIGIERITCYSWRRSAATALYLAAKDNPSITDEYRAVQQYSGHSSISSLIKYINFDANQAMTELEGVL